MSVVLSINGIRTYLLVYLLLIYIRHMPMLFISISIDKFQVAGVYLTSIILHNITYAVKYK